MKGKYLCIFVLLANLLRNAKSFELNLTEYFNMPKLYNFDDYDRCLLQNSNYSSYCFVRAEILPKEDSQIWRTISNISKYDRHHFDHKHLYYGICLNWCLDQLHNLNSNETAQLYAGLLTNNTKVNTYVNLLGSEASNRRRYNRLMNQCINLRLQKQHQLRALSMIEYCENNYYNPIVEDTWNSIFFTLLCSSILLIFLGTCYDFFLRQRSNKMLTLRDHYKLAPEEIYNKICISFSLPRNWYRLNQTPTEKTGIELRFLDCFKFFAMFMVIYAHTVWVIYEGAIENPQDPETMLHTLAGTFLVSGGLIVVTFFVVSGFLLTLNWLAAIKNQKELSLRKYATLFLQFNIFRYIRLTVPYLFVILLSGLYFDNPGGPLWRHIVEREQLSCRKNWWANLLYINNYVNNNERCMLQTWYLAADTHCFIVCLLLLIALHKWPRLNVLLYSTATFVALLMPGLVAYFNTFAAIFIPTPQTQKDSFIDNEQFTYFYAPFQTNFGPYLFGVYAALAYDHLNNKNIKLKSYLWFQCIWYALIPAAFCWMMILHPFFQYYADGPAHIWGAVFAALQRNIWGFGLGVFIIGMTAKIGSIFRRFACLPMFRILGRLTYGAFILHLFMVRFVVGTIRQPLYFGTGTIFTFVLYNVVASYLASFLLAMLVELPVSSLMKLLR